MYYQNKLKTERVRRMFKLTTPCFYHSSHYKVSNTQCSQTKCMKHVPTYILFMNFNYTFKVHQTTKKLMFHSDLGAQVQFFLKHLQPRDITLVGHRQNITAPSHNSAASPKVLAFRSSLPQR